MKVQFVNHVIDIHVLEVCSYKQEGHTSTRVRHERSRWICSEAILCVYVCMYVCVFAHVIIFVHLLFGAVILMISEIRSCRDFFRNSFAWSRFCSFLDINRQYCNRERMKNGVADAMRCDARHDQTEQNWIAPLFLLTSANTHLDQDVGTLSLESHSQSSPGRLHKSP